MSNTKIELNSDQLELIKLWKSYLNNIETSNQWNSASIPNAFEDESNSIFYDDDDINIKNQNLFDNFLDLLRGLC